MATVPNSKTVTGFPCPQNQRTTGYPAVVASFIVPPPPSPFFPFYQNPNPTTTIPRSSSFFCCLISAVAVGFAIVGFTSLILYLVLHPCLPAVRVDNASFTVTSLNTAELTPTFNVSLIFENLNHKLTVVYESFNACIRYGNDDHSYLASTRLPPFSQGTRNETTVIVQFAAVDQFVESAVAKRISEELASGSVNFGVSLVAWYKFKSGIVRSSLRALRVECYPLTFAFPQKNNDTGTLVVPCDCCIT